MHYLQLERAKLYLPLLPPLGAVRLRRSKQPTTPPHAQSSELAVPGPPHATPTVQSNTEIYTAHTPGPSRRTPFYPHHKALTPRARTQAGRAGGATWKHWWVCSCCFCAQIQI